MAVDAQWPTAATDDEFDALLADDATMRPAVIALGRSLGLDVAAVERFPDGSLPVYALGGLVLKLFPPACADDFRIEAGVLAAVAGRLPVPTPGVHATGSQQGWGYVVMKRLHGRPLLEVWPSLLHRYSALARYMERMPAPAEPTLDALADRWFGV